MVTYDGLKKLGVTQSPHYIRQLVRMGRFPRPTSGGREQRMAFHWRESDILEYLKTKAPAKS